MIDLEPVRLTRKTVIFDYKGSALLTEYRKGNLDAWKVANKLYTTKAAVLEMGERLCVTAKGRGSGLNKGQDGQPSITSETERIRQAQAAAQIASEMLRKPLRVTLPSASARTQTSVTSVKSSLPTC